MPKNTKSLSKFLALMLRHQPAKFGVTLDEQGFASLVEVWSAIEKHLETNYTQDDLETIVAGDAHGKKRYEIVGDQIRALYGHSVLKIVYPVVIPPESLYHGTNPAAWHAIRENGLTAQGRQYVHMTTNTDTARIVAARRTQMPIILKINALEAHAAGVVFHQPEAEHYLARAIPSTFLHIHE